MQDTQCKGRSVLSRRIQPTSRQSGLSLVQLAAILAALSLLIAALAHKTADYFSRMEKIDDSELLQVADGQLRHYVVAHGRLPCPDTTGDGISDGDTDGSCGGAQKGLLPYRTLGLADNRYQYGEVPMVYGVFRSGAISFTKRDQVFQPTYQDKEGDDQIVSTSRNTFDFCATLEALRGVSITSVSTGLAIADGIQTRPAVYALAISGAANQDAQPAGWSSGPAISARYDGLNATSANRFEVPQRPQDPTYDDKTLFRSVEDLHAFYRCESLNRSIDLLTQAISIQKEIEDTADGNVSAAKAGTAKAAVGIVMGAWQVGQAIAGGLQGTEEIGKATGLLAAATATCNPFTLFIGCALIPVYAVSLSTAITGFSLFVVGSTAAAATSLGLSITSTVLYADINSRTSTISSATAPAGYAISDERLKQQLADYLAAKATATTAFNRLPTPAPSASEVLAMKATRDSRLSNVNTQISAVTDSTLRGKLSNYLNGSTSECFSPADCSGYTAREVPRTDEGGNVVTNSAGEPVMTTIYTRNNLEGTIYSPGVVPAFGGYYKALSSAGANTPVSSGLSPGDPGYHAITQANAGLSGTNLPSPAAVLATANDVTGKYTQLLQATALFDSRHLAYVQASNTRTACTENCDDEQVSLNVATADRTTALSDLRSKMGDASWNYTGTESLCGLGGCSWMSNASPSPGSSTSLASTSASSVNSYLDAVEDYEEAASYNALKELSNTANNSAWGSRNSLKTSLCAIKSPPVEYVGSGSVPNADPALWDASENLSAANGSGVPTPIGLNCTGGGTKLDTSTQSAAAREAERVKYCTTGSATFDAALCAVYSTTSSRSSVKGAEPIVQQIIQKGVAR